MQITLTSVEMDKAVDLWLTEQGFATDRYTKTTKIVAGRTDSGVGPRLEVSLEPINSKPLFESMGLSPMDIQIATGITTNRKFGQGYSDE